nr:DUF1484 domain-containing protein [Chromobacterium amazonense]
MLACLGDDVRLPSSRIKELLEPLDKRMGESLTLLTRVRSALYKPTACPLRRGRLFSIRRIL